MARPRHRLCRRAQPGRVLGAGRGGRALDFEDGLRLVRRRGEAMREAGEEHPGGMAAILGLDDERGARVSPRAPVTRTATAGSPTTTRPARWSSPGAAPALERAMALAKERQAKRALPLAVSVACHTPSWGAAVALRALWRAPPSSGPGRRSSATSTASALSEPARHQGGAAAAAHLAGALGRVGAVHGRAWRHPGHRGRPQSRGLGADPAHQRRPSPSTK